MYCSFKNSTETSGGYRVMLAFESSISLLQSGCEDEVVSDENTSVVVLLT